MATDKKGDWIFIVVLGALALLAFRARNAAVKIDSAKVDSEGNPVAIGGEYIAAADVVSVIDSLNKEQAREALNAFLENLAVNAVAGNDDVFPFFGYAAVGDTINVGGSTAPASSASGVSDEVIAMLLKLTSQAQAKPEKVQKDIIYLPVYSSMSSYLTDLRFYAALNKNAQNSGVYYEVIKPAMTGVMR